MMRYIGENSWLIKKKDKVDEGEDELEEIVLDDETVVLQEEKEDNLLIPRNDYLSSGVHIGTKLKTIHSEKWIYRTTSYGLYVIDLLATDERVRVAAKFLASFDPEKIMVCSVRRYGRAPVRAFVKLQVRKH